MTRQIAGSQPSDAPVNQRQVVSEVIQPGSRRSFLRRSFGSLAAFGAAVGFGSQAQAAGDACSGFKRKDFEEYIRIFNTGNSDDYAKYYHDDVVLERGELRLEGKEEILEFYRGVHAAVRQTIEVLDFISQGDRFAVELMASFEAFADWSHPKAGGFKKGTRQKANTFVHYNLINGQFALIRSARFRRFEL